MSKEIRGFDYALEPVRCQRDWALERELLALARRQRAVQRSRNECAALHAQCGAQALEARTAWSQRRDSTAHAQALHFLSSLQHRLAQAQARAAEAAEALKQARASCVGAQLRLDVLNGHRAEALNDFSVEAHRRDSAEADRAWSARLAVTRRNPT